MRGDNYILESDLKHALMWHAPMMVLYRDNRPLYQQMQAEPGERKRVNTWNGSCLRNQKTLMSRCGVTRDGHAISPGEIREDQSHAV